MHPFRQSKPKNGRTCYAHGEEIKHICVTKNCMMELCRLCVVFHQELHRQQGSVAAIENYDETVGISLAKLNRLIAGYREETKRLEAARSIKINELDAFKEEVRNKIDRARTQVCELVDTYFDQLMANTNNEYLAHLSMLWTDKINTPIKQMQNRIEKFEQQKRLLASDQREREAIRYAFEKDEERMLDVMRGRVDEWVARGQAIVHDPDKVEVNFERKNIEEFFGVLQELVTLNVDMKDFAAALGRAQESVGDITQDINQDISMLGNRETFGALNDSLGRNAEPWKAPNPHLKEPLRSQNPTHTASAKRMQQTGQFPGNGGADRPADLPAFPVQASHTSARFRHQPEEPVETENEFAIPQSFSQKENKFPSLDRAPQLHSSASYKGGAFPTALSGHSRRSSADLNIEAPNFFDPEADIQVLHFFEMKTKNFHYVSFSEENLALIQAGHKLEFETLTLDIDFTIPRHSRSVITPKGTIVLLGGLVERGGENGQGTLRCDFLRGVYLLDTINCTLEEIEPMGLGRAAHSVLATNEAIFVVGGIVEAGGPYSLTDSCEMYSFRDHGWRQLGNLNQPVMSATLSLVRDQYLVKIGGKRDESTLDDTIEVMDLREQRWRVVLLPPTQIVLPSLACAIEVREGQVLLFGGIYESATKKSRRVIGIAFDEDGEIDSIEEKAQELPYGDGFSESQAIVHNKNIFVLQNESNPQRPGVLLMGKRRILMLDRYEWHVLN